VVVIGLRVCVAAAPRAGGSGGQAAASWCGRRTRRRSRTLRVSRAVARKNSRKEILPSIVYSRCANDVGSPMMDVVMPHGRDGPSTRVRVFEWLDRIRVPAVVGS
jgi:hypothetical protein